jgi:filamentous hemagglutinin
MFGHASMNRAFKLVWNSARGAYVAVPETAKGHGGSASTVKITPHLASVFVTLGLIGGGPGPYAQVMPATTVVPTGSVANAYLAGKGVPVVNINTANSAGVSHNKYTRFDVESIGLVLNNGNTSQAARQSQLAGQVVGNVNLTNEARIIINEVVSTNRSMLGGFIEVLGGRADVIVANPYGITCAGCGFINTDRITLTTGVPVIGLDGALSSFNINRGDILISGAGLNATAQQILDLVSRSVRIDGQINTAAGGTVGITTGLNQWNYADRVVTGSTTAADATPLWALDSTALGGMYAGRIRLIATEAGVGVRMLGSAAANVDDFQLTSAGKVEVRSAISAQRDLQITSTQGKSQALAMTNASLTAKRDINLDAASGSASFDGGAIVAANRLNVKVGSLVDTATTAPVTDNNRRFGSTVTLASAGSGQLSGVSWGSVNDLSVSAADLSVTGTSQTQLYAGTQLGITTTGNMALSTAAVRATGNLDLVATAGTLSTANGAGQGVQSTTGNVNITAGAGLVNAGTITADLANLNLRAGGGIDNSGDLYAKVKIDIADAAAAGSQTLSNSGNIIADTSLLVRASTITNTVDGVLQGSQGSTVHATTLNNSGLVVVSPSNAYDGTLNLSTLTNSTTGVIQSERDLSLNIGSTLSNSGLVLAGRDLKVLASDAGQTLKISNIGDAYLQAGASLSVGGTAGASNVAITTQSGVIVGAQNVDLKLGALNSSGVIQSDQGIQIALTGDGVNSGDLIAAQGLTLSAATLTNSGNVQASQATTITAASLTNSGLIFGASSGAADTVLTLGSLDNTGIGTIQAARGLTMNVKTSMSNAGEILADGQVSVIASDAGTTLGITNQGYLGSGQKLVVTGTAGGSNAQISTQSGTLLAGTNLELKLAGLSNSGVVQANQSATIQSSGGLTNSGFLATGSSLSLSATGTATNTSLGVIQASNGLGLTASVLDNSGLVVGNTAGVGSVELNLATLSNANGGAIESTTDLTVYAASLLSNSGSLYAARDLSLAGSSSAAAASVTNSATAEMLAGRSQSIKAVALNNAGLIQSVSDLTVHQSATGVSNSLTNSGDMVAGQNLKITHAGASTSSSILNAKTGVMQAGATLTLEGSNLDLGSGGKGQLGVVIGKDVVISASQFGGGVDSITQASNSLKATITNNLSNAGRFLSEGDAVVNAGGVANTGVLQSTKGLEVNANVFENYATVIGSTQNTFDTKLNVRTLTTTSGSTIQSARDLLLNVRDTLSNSGELLADRDLIIAPLDANANLTLANNASGLMQAARTLSAGASAGKTNFTLSSQAGTLVAGTVALGVSSLSNSGVIQSDTNLTFNLSGDLNNTGALVSGGSMNLSAVNIKNSGANSLIQAKAGGSIAATGDITNEGAIVGSTEFAFGGPTAGAIGITAQNLTNKSGAVIQAVNNVGLGIGTKLDNSGTISSERTLGIGGTSAVSALSLLNQASGVISASTNQADVVIGDGTNAVDLLNLGTIDSKAKLTINTAAPLNNYNLISGGTLKISATELSNYVAGIIQNTGNFQLNAATLANQGALVLQGGQFADNSISSINANTLFNATGAVLQGNAYYEIYAKDKLENLGLISSTSRLYISNKGNASAQIINRASGVIQGSGLWITTETSAAPTLSTQAGKLLSDYELVLYLSGDLLNTGSIQGGQPYVSSSTNTLSTSVNVAGTLTNDTGASFIVGSPSADPADHFITAPVIINKGSMGSGGNTTLLTGTGGKVENSGTMTFDAALKVIGLYTDQNAANQYTFTNTGTLSVGGLLSLKGMSNNLDINSTSKWFADGLDIVTPTVNIAAGQMLNTAGNLSLVTQQLNFADSTSRIIAATAGGTAKITLPDTYTYNNKGIIFSGGDLELSAKVVNNTDTGALAASGNVSLQAKDSMDNKGALYSGNDMLISTKVFNNAGASASMDAGQDISVTATTSFTNSAAIDAGRDITISSPIFKNQPVGGDTRVFTPYQVEFSPGVFIRIYDGKNGSGTGTGVGLKTIQNLSFKGSYAFSGATPTKPTITANRNITIKDFNAGSNLGGLISAVGTLTLTGVDGKATFLNQALNVTKDSVYTENVEYDCAGVIGFGQPILCLSDPYNYAPASSANPVPGSIVAVTETPVAGSLSATIRAGTLIATGFALTNSGAPVTATVDSKTATGGSKLGLSGLLARASGKSAGTPGSGLTATAKAAISKATGESTVSGGSVLSLLGSSPAVATALRVATNKESGITGVTTASGKPAVQFGGVVINLPVNPNGFFVVNKDPQAQYLVETNPLYGVGSNFVGSDYLAVRYGYNPDVSLKRLGDANYEAYLIKQQLVGTTGSNLLKGYRNEAAQVQGLMDNALAQSKELGLKYGAALTKEQISKLKTSIVWMVETIVDGVSVLAPVVYLPDSVRNAIASGATITGDDVYMDLASVNNKGGTIEGKNTLAVTSKGDITNSGGTIRGGNVSLRSTDGSIVNRTESAFRGNSASGSTVIGKTGLIQSDNVLILDAKKDVTVLGAQVKAGGSAAIRAGGNVTFDTIENRTTSSSSETTRSRGRTTTTTTNTETVTQVKSGLSVGGDLSVKAGNDLTLAGTDVKVGGSAGLSAGNNVNIVARENRTTSTTSTDSKATGAFASLRSSSSSTTNSEQTRNVGTTLNIGGGLNVEANNKTGTVLIQGSDINAGGNVRLAGNDVKVLEGRNTDTSTTTTTSRSAFLSSNRGASGTSDGNAGNAQASGSAQGSAQSGVTFRSTTNTTTTNEKSTSVGSSINAGKSIVIEANNDLTTQGSSIKAAENLFIDAKNVNVLAATNTDKTTRSSSTASVGLFTDSTNKANAGAEASTRGGTAQASAGGEAKSENNLDLMRLTTTTSRDLSVTNTGSNIAAGGNVVINATNKVTVQGSDISGDRGVSITGKDIAFLAAQDVKISETTTNTTSQGLYLDAEGKAKANAGAGAGGAGAFGQADGKLSGGTQVRSNTDTSRTGSSNARVSSVTSSAGNVERTATNNITDVGTSISAAGAFVQKSDTFTSSAAANTTFSESSSTADRARVGAFIGGEAQQGKGVLVTQDASGKTNNQVGAGQGTGGGGKGVEVELQRNTTNDRSKTSDAVVSTIRAGSVDITTTGKASLEGTKIQAKDNVVLDVGSLDFRAAANTTSSSSDGTGTRVGAEIGKKEVTLSGERSDSTSNLQTSNAVVGGISAGGNVTIRSAGNARLEGTNVQGASGVNVDVGGNLEVAAARNTVSGSSLDTKVGGEVSVGKGSKGTGVQGGKLDASVSASDQQSSSAVASTIGSSGGPVTINAGGNVRTEGTNINSGTGQSSLSAGGTVRRDAAVSTSSSNSVDASLNASVGGQTTSKGDSRSGGTGSASLNVQSSDQTTSSAGNTDGLKVTQGAKPATTTKTPTAAERRAAAAKAKADADAKKKAEAEAKAKAAAEAKANAAPKPPTPGASAPGR